MYMKYYDILEAGNKWTAHVCIDTSKAMTCYFLSLIINYDGWNQDASKQKKLYNWTDVGLFLRLRNYKETV